MTGFAEGLASRCTIRIFAALGQIKSRSNDGLRGDTRPLMMRARASGSVQRVSRAGKRLSTPRNILYFVAVEGELKSPQNSFKAKWENRSVELR